jgi:hypothetical protein
LIDDLALAEDDVADALAHLAQALAQRVDLGNQVARGGGDGQVFGDAHEVGFLALSFGEIMTDKGAPSKGLDRPAASAVAPADDVRRQPIDCGDLGMNIARDGTWFYRGSPIARMPLVRLFSRVLRREADGTYWLVTPAERGRITVEDAPFVAIELTRHGDGRDQALIFRTNVDDTVAADAAHPLRVASDAATREPRPYILVRNGLEARLSRSVFYELVELGREERVGDATLFGVWSSGKFFPLGSLDGAP